MEENMVNIRNKLKVEHGMQKIYADKNRTYRELKVGEYVFLKVKAKRSFLRLVSFLKLAVRYYGPFEVLDKIGLVAYMVSFFASMRICNVFHVSLLKKYVPDPNHVISWIVIQVEHEGDFYVELVHTLDHKFKVLNRDDFKDGNLYLNVETWANLTSP
jgi:hypothetical protein